MGACSSDCRSRALQRRPFYIRKRLDGWKKAVAEGHEIGNHSNTHPCTANYSFSRLNALENYTLEMMAAQLDGANAEIETLLGVKPRTFAYPCGRSEEHTSELQSRLHLVCRLLLEKKKTTDICPKTSVYDAGARRPHCVMQRHGRCGRRAPNPSPRPRHVVQRRLR